MPGLIHTSSDCPTEVNAVNGMTVSRDCMDNCFYGKETILNDGICDNGLTGYLLQCPLWNYDITDCTYNTYADNRVEPTVTCLHTCPS